MQRTILSILLGLTFLPGCDQTAGIGGDLEDETDLSEDFSEDDAESSDPTRLPGADCAEVDGEGGSGGEEPNADSDQGHGPGMLCEFWNDNTEDLDPAVECPDVCTMHTWEIKGFDQPWYALDCAGWVCLLQENQTGPWNCYPGGCELDPKGLTSTCEIDHG